MELLVITNPKLASLIYHCFVSTAHSLDFSFNIPYPTLDFYLFSRDNNLNV